MQYLYLAKLHHKSVQTLKGVEVVEKCLIQTTTTTRLEELRSDLDGFFKMTFEPQVPGDYTVIAEFGGSQIVYSLLTKTAISVTEAPDREIELYRAGCPCSQ